MNINDYKNKYTKQEFIKEIKKGYVGKIQTRDNCPSSWNLIEHECNRYTNCNDCWTDALDGIKFKGENDIIEKPTDDYKWIFNIQEFKEKDIVINCETKEESEQLFDILIKNGIMWQDDIILKLTTLVLKDMKVKLVMK